MKLTHNLMRILGVMVAAGMLVSACTPAATVAPTTAATEAPTTAPEPTEAPTVAPTEVPPTEAPTEEAAPTEEPTEAGPVENSSSYYAAPDCDYGGEFKSLEAVDELTVKITLC